MSTPFAGVASAVIDLYDSYSLPRIAQGWRIWSHERVIWLHWIAQRKPLPPPHALKVATVRSYGRRFGLTRFVETGTYVGTTLADVEPHFVELYSVELGEDLYAAAVARFAGHDKVQLFQGDSASVLPSIVDRLTGPALFWLDGHWSDGVTARGSSDTPVRAELEAVFAAPARGHVVLVDDARCFTGKSDYPSIPELGDLVRRLAPTYKMTVRDDIIRLVPPR